MESAPPPPPLLCNRSPEQQAQLRYLCNHEPTACYTCNEICYNPAKNVLAPKCRCMRETCVLCGRTNICAKYYSEQLTFRLRCDLRLRDDDKWFDRENPDFRSYFYDCGPDCRQGQTCQRCLEGRKNYYNCHDLCTPASRCSKCS